MRYVIKETAPRGNYLVLVENDWIITSSIDEARLYESYKEAAEVLVKLNSRNYLIKRVEIKEIENQR